MSKDAESIYSNSNDSGNDYEALVSKSNKREKVTKELEERDKSIFKANDSVGTPTTFHNLQIFEKTFGKKKWNIDANTNADEGCWDRSGLEEEDCEDKSNRKMKKRILYNVYLGKVSISTQTVVTPKGFLNDNFLRNEIDIVLRTELGCPCPVRFYGGIRANEKYHFVGYAKCAITSHQALFRFDVLELDEHILEIRVSSDKPMIKTHDTISMKPFSQIRGPKRKELKKLLKYNSVTMVQLRMNKDTDAELAIDGHVGNAKHLRVLGKMKSEERCEGRLYLKSIDLQDCAEFWMRQHTLKDPAIQVFTLPLQILIFTEEQVKACLDAMPEMFHFDATLAMCRTPNNLKCKILLYYAMLYRGRDSTIPLFEMFTSQHDRTSIEIALQRFRAFVLKVANKWPIVKAIVVDWSWVFINSINFEWNDGMKISEYLDLTWDMLTGKKSKPAKLIIILTCNAHVLRRIAKTIDGEDEMKDIKPHKTFFMECTALIILATTLEEMDVSFEDLLNVILQRDKKKLTTH